MYESFLSLPLLEQLLIAFFAGVIFDSIIMFIYIFAQRKQLFAYQRQLEKKSISTDESSAKVKVLEAKIQVLEKALDDALNK